MVLILNAPYHLGFLSIDDSISKADNKMRQTVLHKKVRVRGCDIKIDFWKDIELKINQEVDCKGLNCDICKVRVQH